MNKLFKFSTIFLLFLSLGACHFNQSYKKVTGQTMGTTFLVRYEGGASLGTKFVLKEINNLLVEINLELSTYISESAISKFNRSEVENWSNLGPHFAKVYDYAQKIYNDSEGLFDPTIYPLVQLYGFGPNIKSTKVSKNDLRRVLPLVGFNKVAFDKIQGRIKKTINGVGLDFSAIAKGYAVDQVSLLLSSLGVSNYLVEIGGEVSVNGSAKGDRAWKIGIERPQIEKGLLQKILSFKDEQISLASSGNYRNFIVKNGKKIVHIINPKNGRAEESSLLSATVLASSCALSDAWATALMAAGFKKSVELIKKNNLAAYLIFDSRGNYSEYASKEFIKRIQKRLK